MLSTMDDPNTAIASDIPLIDSASMIALLQVNQQTMTGQRRQRRVATHDDDDDASVATTRIASSVGSVVGDPRNAFLKSMTIIVTDNTIDQLGLDLVLKDVMPRPTRNRLAIVGMDYMHKCLKEGEGKEQRSLCVTVGNKEGDDILVQATIIKPKPTMTYQEMGMVVWFWQYLCIKSIEKSSVFYNSALKPQDHLISINDIVCRGLKPAQVAEIISSLPQEITVTVLRRKQRLSGAFG
jgi:hypothetical protein